MKHSKYSTYTAYCHRFKSCHLDFIKTPVIIELQGFLIAFWYGFISILYAVFRDFHDDFANENANEC